MIVAIPILPSTVSAAETLLERIANLGGVSQYPVVLVSGGQVDLAPCHKLASAAFKSVSVFPVNVPDNYPLPSNVLFARTAQHMGNTLGSAYLYLEPDSYPTSSTWLSDLVASYRETGHRFMGKLVPMPEPNPRNELHMLTTGIYARDFFATSNLLRQMSPTVPASQFLNGEIVYVGKAHDSSLFSFTEGGIAALVLQCPSLREGESFLDPYASLHKNNALNRLNEVLDKQLLEVAPANSAPQSGFFSALAGNLGKPAQRGEIGDFDAVSTPQGIVSGKEYLERHPELRAPNLDAQGIVSPGAEMVQPIHEVEVGSVRVGEPIATIPELHKPRVSASDIAERLAKSQPSMEYLHNPAALDSSIEVPQPIIPAAIEPEPAVPIPIFGNEEERNLAIKQAKADGMPWKQILSTFKVSAKEASRVLNAV